MKSVSPKAVVQTFAQYVGEEAKDSTDKKGNSVRRVYLVYEFRNECCIEPKRRIKFEKNTDFNNPYHNLKSCIADNDPKTLQKLYIENLRAEQAASKEVYFKPFLRNVSGRDIALHDYIELIVVKSMPISIVEDNLLRKVVKHDYKFCSKNIKCVLLVLAELVDRKIGIEMKEIGWGTILHDGWTCCSVNYIKLFVSYMKKENIKEHPGGDANVQLALLSCSPMSSLQQIHSQAGDSEELGEDEATSFTTEIHAEHIKSMFSYYSVNPSRWIQCQVTDNCVVNTKVVKLLHIPHVACKNHLLNLEANHMVRSVTDLRNVIDYVHGTMLECKQTLRISSGCEIL